MVTNYNSYSNYSENEIKNFKTEFKVQVYIFLAGTMFAN